MKYLAKYLKNYKLQIILGPLFKLLEASFELFVPLAVASMIDNGIGKNDSGHIIRMVAVLIVLGLIGFICAVTAQYFSAKAATGFAGNIRSALFKKIQGMTFTELDEIGSSTLLTRITSDVNQVQSGTNLALRLLLRSPFIVFGALIMAFTIDARIAGIFAVIIAILFLVVFTIMLTTIPLYRKNQEKLDKVYLSVKENLAGVRVIRAFCRENEEVSEFKKRNGELCRGQLVAGRIGALMNPLTYAVINIGVVLLIRNGAVKVNSGVTQGQVVALYNYMSQILVELIKLASLIITITRSLACADRISDILQKPAFDDRKNAASDVSDAEYRVVFENAAFKYESSSENVLEGIVLKVLPGETIGIIGATGSGKSSLVNLIPRFYPCTSGTVRVDGRDVKSYDDNELRRKIGFVMQRSELFKGTIRDNMKWAAPDANDDEINDALERAQVLDVVNSKGGLDAEVSEGGKNFSGGQKQRLSIARALVGKPEILILDDSSSALDFATDAALRHAIATLPYSPTVFVVSQRASSLMHSDRIILLSDGKVAAAGTHDELMKTSGEYRDIYYLQFPEKKTEGGAAI